MVTRKKDGTPKEKGTSKEVSVGRKGGPQVNDRDPGPMPSSRRSGEDDRAGSGRDHSDDRARAGDDHSDRARPGSLQGTDKWDE
jgi:hypothetical protein